MKKIYLVFLMGVLAFSCQERISSPGPVNFTFDEISSIKIGGEAAAEITAFDPMTKTLFVVNNSDGLSQVDVVDFSEPSTPLILTPIDIAIFGGGVNSVAVKNGKLAIAIQANTKTDPGAIVVFETSNLGSPIENITVGALPDMVTFSPDGRYIVSANEGEPNDDYDIDPEGTISIIDTQMDYQVTTLNFASFENQRNKLEANGFRIFGPNASFSQDIEPEYVTIDASSDFAWVTLQENNGIAKVDLNNKVITDIFPMGLKNHMISGNEIDVSDRDGVAGNFQNWPLLAYYMPDAIESFQVGNNNFLITANEGDTRDYDGYGEEGRVKDIALDPTAFPDGALLQEDENLGRYTITTSKGDIDNDGDFDILYGIGGRSFSIWNGSNGKLVRDYNKLESDLISANPSLYDDGRSDNKGVEPEGVEVGEVRGKTIVFIGLERSDAIMVYELNGAAGLKFLQVLDGKSGIGNEGHDAPEGLLFISAEESPNGKPLFIVSSEGDGRITVYQN
ncbi:choice-of-anchor I family protein [Algoriphagus sp.]|uniref:choice-of-anchor I family protein n=1 Tax=Algoriphagus sp. TaxID=1872435 RepID=UPI0025EE9E07|nr:choice-of-anchor I family protein [Algoriphagus sp.]